MKQDRFYLAFIIMLLFISPLQVISMGNSEKNAAYDAELSAVFKELTDRIYSGETDSAAARAELGRLREKYGIPYTDKEGVLESIIDRAYERSITPDETHYYFGMLKDGSLMEYRSRAARARTGAGLQRLFELLLDSMENGQEGDPGDMLSVLNNYYDILGLEYDDYYFSLNNLIQSYRDGRITEMQVESEIDSLAEKAASEQRLSEDRSRSDYPPERSESGRAENGAGGTSAGQGAASGNPGSGNEPGPQAEQGHEGSPQRKSGTGGGNK